MGTLRRILVAEDNEAEAFLYQRAFQKIGIADYLIVTDGEQTIDYLSGAGKFSDRNVHPFPHWLLLDIKMPRKTGFDVLHWITEHPACKVVPTIVMSNSNQTNDVSRAYELCANAFFTKPTRLQELVDILALIHHFWTIAQCPPTDPLHKGG